MARHPSERWPGFAGIRTALAAAPTDKSLRPAQPLQVLKTRCLIGKPVSPFQNEWFNIFGQRIDKKFIHDIDLVSHFGTNKHFVTGSPDPSNYCFPKLCMIFILF